MTTEPTFPRPTYASRQTAKRLADETDHYPHDYGTNGRCRTPGCNIYDPTEDDDRIDDPEDMW